MTLEQELAYKWEDGKRKTKITCVFTTTTTISNISLPLPVSLPRNIVLPVKQRKKTKSSGEICAFNRLQEDSGKAQTSLIRENKPFLINRMKTLNSSFYPYLHFQFLFQTGGQRNKLFSDPCYNTVSCKKSSAPSEDLNATKRNPQGQEENSDMHTKESQEH